MLSKWKPTEDCFCDMEIKEDQPVGAEKDREATRVCTKDDQGH